MTNFNETKQVYWIITNTAVSSARLYWDNRETAKKGFFDVKNVQIPVAVTVFPDEIYAAPKTLTWNKTGGSLN